MYEDFFGLNGRPFELSPDPFFLFSSERTREALASISYAVARRKGFVVLTGEVGTGKTLLLRCLFESWEREEIPFAYIIGPRLSTVDFLGYITFELGIEVPDPTKGNLLRALYEFLLDQFEKGLTTVLVIDEAHQIPRSVLEEIRMLANFETAQEKLIQVLLVGQPELDKKLDSFELRSLKQRIATRCQLQPLREEEVGRYVERRLQLSGADMQAASIFPVETIGAVYRYSEGIPRLVNSICDQALIMAYARKVCVVPVEVIDEVASHLRLKLHGGLRQTKPLLHLNQTENSGPDMSAHGSSHDLPLVSVPVVEIRRPEPIWGSPSETANWKTEAPRLPPDLSAFSDISPISESPNSFKKMFSSMWWSRSRRATAAQENEGYASSRVGRVIWVVIGALVAVTAVGATGSYLFRGQVQTFVPTGAVSASPPPAMKTASVVETPSPAPLPSSVGRPAERSEPSIAPVVPAPPAVAPEARNLTIAKLQAPVRKSSSPASVSSEPPLILTDPVNDLGGPGNASSLLAGAGATQPALPPATSVRPAVGGRLEPPQLISSKSPVYPANARTQHVQGGVTLDALVDETGTVVETTVLGGPALLHAAAIDTVRAWKYKPARMNGQPVPIHVKVTVRFVLN